MARISELCQEVRDILANELPPADSAERAYAYEPKVVSPGGKVIRVFGVGYSTAERITRRHVHREYRVAVEVWEQYEEPQQAGTAGPVPTEWLDERVEWVQANVFEVLDGLGLEIEDRLLGAFWPQTCEVPVLYDEDRLHAGIFRSVVEVAYREQVEG